MIKGFSSVQTEKWFTFEAENARPTRSNNMVTDEGESLSKSNSLHSLMKETMNVCMNESVNE